MGTFTRAVARALTKDFSAEENEEPPVVGTLHQLALKILKDHPAALKGRTPKFLLRHETECLLADIGPEVGGDLNDRKKWMKQLEADWSRGDPLGEAAFDVHPSDAWVGTGDCRVRRSFDSGGCLDDGVPRHPWHRRFRTNR